MKFEKFAKSLAPNGVIYESQSGPADLEPERWLASARVFMRIPPVTECVTALSIQPMPAEVESYISRVGNTQPAMLVDARMLTANGGIKDCVRVFESEDGSVRMGIANEDWALLNKSDMMEILCQYDLDSDTNAPKALLVKQYPKYPDQDMEIVGLIFPTEY